ncbi:MAG: V-type ATP synthase subunit B [Candidatus Woesearchaeota archaeon]|nr:MAG: V-type ATP synthase subunit B [Candidatus Woesearchaeota archaeon]
MTKLEYKTIERVAGPLVFVKETHPVGYGELVEVNVHGETKLGQVLETAQDFVVVQLFEGTSGVDKDASVKFLGEPLTVKLDENIKGRVLSGIGRPLDKGPQLTGKKFDIGGAAINPFSRQFPNNFIQTGISSIDMMTTLIRGQKLPIFSGSGLPHNDIALQIARQAKVVGEKTDFLVVFAAMGITNEEALKFQRSFEESGAIENAVLFINKADDPSVERLVTPRMALTTAEYFAFEKGAHVLVIFTDLTNYCESLREIGAAREEIPGRRGYPGYMYTDLAQLYERAGLVKGRKGSVTQIPILTMPGDDKTHPIPDLTGYITEGQVVIGRELHRKNIYPPIDVLPSLSRLMGPGTGEGKTRDDHKKVSDQCYALYAEGRDMRGLVAIVGEEALSERDRRKLHFAKLFEEKFLQQGLDEDRSFDKTMDIAWDLLRSIPREELTKIDDKLKDKYY